MKPFPRLPIAFAERLWHDVIVSPTSTTWRLPWLLIAALLACSTASADEARRPAGDNNLRFWLHSMVAEHGYSTQEAADATGMSRAEVASALQRLAIPSQPSRPNGLLKVLPYPGGRHPRLGFLDGAVRPQRDTKLSVFAPWDGGGYVVIDVPEAVWSSHGLTYLAHSHIPTVWERAGVPLPPVEWSPRADGSWQMLRVLPNGVAFGVRARAHKDHVALRWWVRNGSSNTLGNVHAQVCVMLGRATGFDLQSSSNKVIDSPFAAASTPDRRRWVVTAWDALQRTWSNPPVPCIHSDPRLGDVPAGETREARGWLWFHDGTNIVAELARLRRDFLASPAPAPDRLLPIPNKLVVLTFDDSVRSLHENVRPILKEAGFNASFFITEGFSFLTNKSDYMTWRQVADLHHDGFEVGNHTRSHTGVAAESLGRLHGELAHISERCMENGIPRPISFAYPGNAIHPGALPILAAQGVRFARRGAQPEFAYESGRGIAYDPAHDHPLLIPTTGDARPSWTLENLKAAVAMARDGKVAVLQFHGVPDREHPWVNTPLDRFREYIAWLRANGYQGIALRDLSRYIDPSDAPAAPWDIIDQRVALHAAAAAMAAPRPK